MSEIKKFNEKSLAEFDGTDPEKPAYVAYKGKVYDVTGNPLFIDGLHFEHTAGMDLTEDMDEAPHSDKVMEELTVVGDYSEND
jgi:predicted heme/steroid binding protein